MQETIQILKALSDETRLNIISLMKEGEICVCDITETLQVSQPKISFHLNVLKEAGIIIDRKQGKWVHYSINDSDLFGRFLVLSVLDRIPSETMRKNISRLEKVLAVKNKCCE
ncbi:MAG: metalloregulator ArsR/SmtB family transcription factor [Nitrospirae bacterium]|nr:metalloregulator ArsR/SmtB family transcription factor [Nitrospirota bacterium]